MNNAWILCAIGIAFCITGVYLFFKKVYEENQSIRWPVMIIILGVLLIGVGTARYFNLID